MLVGIIILILGLALIIIDGFSTPKWRLLGTIWAWLNNRIVRRVIRILLVLAITVGGLFIISSIGFISQGIPGLSEKAKNGLMWLTLMPVFVAGVIVWLAFISGAAVERMARGFAKMLGFNIAQQTTLEAWEKSFLAVMFWVYIMLSLYPIYNPWTGSPKMFLFICGFALALATYARWAAMKGKGPKLFAIIMVPLFFLYCLGKQQPNAYPTLGSLVRWSEALGNRENAKRDLGSAVKNQQADFYRDGEEIIKNNTYALLKSDVIALDENLNQIVLEEGYKEEAKILQKLAPDALPPKLKVLFTGSTEKFYKVQFMDDLGKYTIRSKIGYIETAGIKGIINIPEAPEVKDPNKNASNPSAGQREANLGPPPRGGPGWKGAGWLTQDDTTIPAGYSGLRLTEIQGRKGDKITVEGPAFLVWDVIDSNGQKKEGSYAMNSTHKLKNNGWLHVHTQNNSRVPQDVHFEVSVE